MLENLRSLRYTIRVCTEKSGILKFKKTLRMHVTGVHIL